MKKVRIFVTAILIAMSFNNVAFAEENALSVDTAVKSALQKSLSIKNQLSKIEKDKNNYDMAIEASERAREAIIHDDQMRDLQNKDQDTLTDSEKSQLSKYRPLTEDQRYGLIITRDVSPLDAEYQMFEDKNQENVIENAITSSVYSQYSQLMNDKDMLDLYEKKLSNSQDKYNKAQLQLQLGMISKLDALKSGTDVYINDKANLAKQQRLISSMQMDFNRTIGEDITKKYSEYSKDNTTDVVELKSLDYYINEALKNRAEIANAQEYFNTKQKEYDLISREFLNKNDKKNKSPKISLDIAAQKLDLAKNKVQAEITNSYGSLKVKMTSLQYDKQNFQKAKDDYNIAHNRYQLGMISKIDFEAAEINYKAVENSLKSKERDVFIGQLNLDYACGKGMATSNNASSSSTNSTSKGR